MSKIMKMEVTNFKRLKAFEVDLDQHGNLIMVAGRNAQGKTSVLDAIAAALGGVNKKTTPKPIREGADNAEIALETEDLVIVRRFTKSGTTLTVSNKDGAKYPKGQAKLDDLIGKLSLDPLAFTQLSEKQQLEALLDLVELPFDPADLEQQRKELYDHRADLGRQVKAVGEVTVDDSLPEKEQSSAVIFERMEQSHQVQKQRDHLNGMLADLREERGSVLAQIAALQQRLEDIDEEGKEAAQQLTELPEPEDTDQLRKQLAEVDQMNALIRANNAARAQLIGKNNLQRLYDDATQQIQALDSQKEEGLAQATMPVAGLGFDAEGITYNGQPFQQASAAEQLRVSLAMAIALNPKLRVIRITDGSLLDADNLAMIKQMAEEHDCQIWIEIVGEGDGTGFVIEDGELVQ